MKAAIITVAGISSRFNEGVPEDKKELKAIYTEGNEKDTLLYHLLLKCSFADKIIIVGGYKFEDLNKYRFDFYIIDKQYCIEYDGETHYQANLHGWHDKEQLKQQQERDEIKNQYCKEHNIPLIRIPYTHLKDLCIDDLRLETSQYII